MLPPRRLLALLLTAFAVVLSSLPAGWSAAASASTSASNSASTNAGEAEPSLPHPAHGQQAINLLGDQLDEAAKLNGWTSAQLRHVLATDSTAWVDGNGRVYYIDPAAPAHADSADEPQGVAPYPLGDTFLLHSKPGSNLTLLIDFDGANVSGTNWNAPPPGGQGVPNGDYPAWTVDGDATTFNPAEREAIQTIWQRVAEDYAPFNIDVTTQDPGLAGIERANFADPVYGTRALVTPSNTAQTAICGGPSCGGVAYVDVFGQTGNTYHPAWIFPQSLSNDAKNIAEAVSHEVGHNFSLQHDGTTVGQTLAPCVGATGYYCGHDMWAPVMGVGYYRPVAQWSQGEYANASNTGQNDLALLAARAPYRTDEAGGTIGTAAAGLPTIGYITTAADTDTFLLGSCSGTVTLSATGAAPNPNLDIQLELLNSAGTVVATNNPASAFVDRDNATGLTASISTGVAAGSYYARVDGVGNGTGATGYTDYGSIGAYTSALTGCTAATAPSAPTNLQVSPAANGQSATVTWAAPASNGGSALTGYTLTRTGGTPVDLGLVGTHNWSGLTAGTTYTFTVAAKNAVGTGPAVSQAAGMPAVPTAPTNLQVNPAANGQSATVTWAAPASNGGSALTGYTLTRTGGTPVDLGLVGTHNWTGLTPGTTYTFTVAAKNAVGTGPAASDTVAMPVPPTVPSVPTNLQVNPAANGQSATVTWTAPASNGGSAVTGYTVSRTGASPEDQVTLTKTWTGLTPGASYTFTVAAKNAVGTGPAASEEVAMPVPPTAPSVPTNLQVTPAANGQSATVTWTAPASNGGSAVTGYTVSRTGASPEDQVTLTKTWTGLTPGASYTFTVAAKNAVGTGPAASDTVAMPVPPTAPSVPTNLQVSPAANGQSATVTWTAPSSDGGSALTGYTVSRTGAAAEDQVTLTKTWTGLTPGSTYTFTVAAKNAVGTGPTASDTVAMPVPPTAPSVPTNLQVNPAANGQSATVTWTAPASNGGSALTGYTLTRTGGTPVDLGLVGTHTWTGLTPGATYTFTVAAKNAVGTGPAASDTVAMPVPPTAPSVPTNLQVNPAANGQSATVTWTAPASNGGSAINGYTVSRTGAAAEDQVTLTKTWTGLTPGSTYTFTVAAKNAVGTGPAASEEVAMPVPPTAPSVPTNLQVNPAANGQSATVTWTAPASNGGSALTGYTLTRTGGTPVDLGLVGTHNWTGLTPGASYTFTVAAKNAVGTGPAASDSVTMPTAPSAPTGLVVTPSANGQSATVTWSPPASNGGSAVTGYTVTRTGGTPVDLGVVGTHTWTGLTPGSTYSFTAAAKNAVGTGPTASDSVTMPTAPSAPTGLVVTPSANGQSATVTWTAPASNGGSAVTGYTVTRTGGTPVDLGVVGTHTWTGLTPGTTYTFTAAAKNAVGPGTQASVSVSLPTTPGAPVVGKAKSGKAGGKKTAKISWSAPATTGGSALTGYKVLVFKKRMLVKTFSVAAGAKSYTAKLKAGKYQFAVVALNAAGAGPQSALSKKATAQ